MTHTDTQLKKKFEKKFCLKTNLGLGWNGKTVFPEDIWSFIHSAVEEGREKEGLKIKSDLFYKVYKIVYPDGNGFSWGSDVNFMNRGIKMLLLKLRMRLGSLSHKIEEGRKENEEKMFDEKALERSFNRGWDVGYYQRGKQIEKEIGDEKQYKKGNAKLVNAWIEGWNAHRMVVLDLLSHKKETKKK